MVIGKVKGFVKPAGEDRDEQDPIENNSVRTNTMSLTEVEGTDFLSLSLFYAPTGKSQAQASNAASSSSALPTSLTGDSSDKPREIAANQKAAATAVADPQPRPGEEWIPVSRCQHRTRAATLAGVFPPPPPLFSPTSQSMSFGSIEAGELDVDVTAVAVGPSAAAAARPSFAPASRTVTPVARPPSAAGEISPELPSLLDSNVDFASGTESTLAQAASANNMSKDELLLLANRYAALASQLRGQAEQDQEIKMTKAHLHSDKRSEMAAPTEVRQDIAPPTESRHRVTVEEIEDENAPIIHPGPSRDKGKGPDVRNWGEISSLQNFSEEDLRKQRDALAAEANRIIKQEDIR
ncbi:hypothetical protein R3P38DRAFT_2805259 [Favolaschia claudopus]|uniref:Uncharacterized protein n=1 Tax=Favolaschia claudopus TaxID=2862362 RepID=A0AAV9ZMT8_9AGAR